MSIATALANARTKIAACYTAISGKGGTLPTTQDLANMPEAINSISGGGGGLTAERKIITEAGAYTAPTGKAYTPVFVTVGMTPPIAINGTSIVEACGTVTDDTLTAIDLTNIDLTKSLDIVGFTAVGTNVLKEKFKTFTGGYFGLPTTQSIGESGLEQAFYNCMGLTSLSLAQMATVGEYGLDRAFYGCARLTGNEADMRFSFASEIDENNFNNAPFSGNTAKIQTLSFPELTTVNDYGFNYAFSGCTGITNLSFPKLATVGDYGFNYAFGGCTELTSVSFPELTAVGDHGLYDAFSGCPDITELHFRSDAKSVIEAQAGYDTKFGATNATIYFDL